MTMVAGKRLIPTTTLFAKIGFVLLILFLAFYNLPNYPTTWYDEGSHLHVPKTLLRFGVYADYSSEGFRYYGPTVGVGPTVFLPIALVFKFFNIGLLQARLVMVLYLLGTIYVFYRLGVLMLGSGFAWLALVLLVGSQAINIIEYGREVLGEVPGFLFLAGALLLWYEAWESAGWKRLALVGLLFGLAMVTKYQYVIVVVPVLGLSWLANLIYYRNAPQRLYILPGIVAAVVLACWMGYQIVYLGPSTITENITSFRQFTSGAALVFSTDLMRRALNELVSLKTFAGGLLPILAYSLVLALPRSKQGQQWGILFILVAVNLGWYVIASISWLRYAFPGLTILTLFVARFFKDGMEGIRLDLPALWKESHQNAALIGFQAVRYALLLWLAFMVAIPLAQTTASVVKPKFNSPQAMADYMNAHVPLDKLVETWEPEMGFLTDHNYHFPPQLLLNTAVGYIWTGGKSPAEEYHFIQTEAPEYVLVGEFSIYANAYPWELLHSDYQLLTTIGAYELYQRNK